MNAVSYDEVKALKGIVVKRGNDIARFCVRHITGVHCEKFSEYVPLDVEIEHARKIVMEGVEEKIKQTGEESHHDEDKAHAQNTEMFR